MGIVFIVGRLCVLCAPRGNDKIAAETGVKIEADAPAITLIIGGALIGENGSRKPKRRSAGSQ